MKDQLPIDAENAYQPVRGLDAAEADSTVCRGCDGRADYRVTHGLASRDYCERCLEEVLACWTPVPYDVFPTGF